MLTQRSACALGLTLQQPLKANGQEYFRDVGAGCALALERAAMQEGANAVSVAPANATGWLVQGTHLSICPLTGATAMTAMTTIHSRLVSRSSRFCSDKYGGGVRSDVPPRKPPGGGRSSCCAACKDPRQRAPPPSILPAPPHSAPLPPSAGCAGAKWGCSSLP